MEEQLPGQISLFDDMPEPETPDPLREIMLLTMWEGAHVRILAALSYPGFGVYALDYLKAEYETCGHSVAGGFVDFRRSGIRHVAYRHGAPPVERVYTWKAALGMIRKLIDAGEYLTREEEREVERIVQAYGLLPYPLPHRKYPESAWEGRPEGYPIPRPL